MSGIATVVGITGFLALMGWALYRYARNKLA